MKSRDKEITCKLFLRLFTLKDKKSAFRPSEPDSHIVQIMVKNGNMVHELWGIRFRADEEQAARDYYFDLIEDLEETMK